MATEDREARKREQEAKKLKAIQSKLRADRPWLRGEELDNVQELISDGIMSHEEVIGKLDENLVLWWKNGGAEISGPDENGKYKYQITEAMLKKGLAAFNKWVQVARLFSKRYKATDYEIRDILNAEVKIFNKFELTGIHFLAVTTKDANKFRFILEPSGKKVGENIKAKENQGWTSSQKVTVA